MGADFTCSMLVVAESTALNWQAGQDVIAAWSEEEITETLRLYAGDLYSVHTALREAEVRVPASVVDLWDEATDGLLDDKPDAEQVALLRQGIALLFTELEGVIEGDVRARDMTRTRPTNGFDVYVTGGLSSGDSPTETSDLFDACYQFTDVLGAIGFEMGNVTWTARPASTRSNDYAQRAVGTTP